MTEGRVTVVRIGDLAPHSNADTLDVTRVWDYPVIVRRGDFATGDLAAYVPVDSVVPDDDLRWAFLAGHNRIKAKRLRGIFSMGLLIKSEPGWNEGDDVTDALRVTRYEPCVSNVHGAKMQTENEPDGSTMPVYTDIEGLRRWSDVLVPGEPVVVTEKIHGANGRFCWHAGRLWVGSHKQIKKQDPANMWWQIADRYDLATKLAAHPDVAIYGEVFGQVQDLKYGHEKGEPFSFALCDAMDLTARRYMDWPGFLWLCADLAIVHVPILASAPWHDRLRELAEGKTVMPGCDHVREGIVVKPVCERWHDKLGRVILKQHGEGYLLRKDGGAKPPYNDAHAEQIKARKRGEA
jgi:RNA ligase (TIGR02306 family)